MCHSKLRNSIFLISVMVSTPSVFSQDFVPKGAVYGGAGYGKFYDDEGALGSGITYRAGGEWRVFRRLGIEAELLGIHFTRGDYFQVTGDSQFGFVNAVYYFSKSGVQPYFKGGVGLYGTKYTYTWPSSSSQEYHHSKSGAAFDVGAGLRFFVNRHWSVNPDFRVAGGAGYYSLFCYFSMSAAYHW